MDLSAGSVDRFSPSQTKIKLFRSLFRGRDDIYARRFESRKTGKSCYAPACANEWVRGICEKPQIKCAECAHRRFLPLTDDVIRWHLSGCDANGQHFVAGVYPMLPDETCFFLAVDKEAPIVGELPRSLELVLGNEIYIAKEGLLPGLRNRLLRVAAFQNPEFYKAQAMRLPTYDKPRIIACAEDHPHHIGLPRGLSGRCVAGIDGSEHSACRSRRTLRGSATGRGVCRRAPIGAAARGRCDAEARDRRVAGDDRLRQNGGGGLAHRPARHFSTCRQSRLAESAVADTSRLGCSMSPSSRVSFARAWSTTAWATMGT